MNNIDWQSNWVFFDTRFNLMFTSDESFLAFLTETIHPVVRPDTHLARKLASIYNAHLRADGWRLLEAALISGRPLFRATRVGVGGKGRR